MEKSLPRLLEEGRVEVKLGINGTHIYEESGIDRLLSHLAEAKRLLCPMYGQDWFSLVGHQIHANKLRHGWKVTTSEDWADQHEIPAVLMLITSELAEALEAFRKDDRANFEEELADVMIRTIGLAHGMGIDLKSEILKKVEKNRSREYKHGGKRV